MTFGLLSSFHAYDNVHPSRVLAHWYLELFRISLPVLDESAFLLSAKLRTAVLNEIMGFVLLALFCGKKICSIQQPCGISGRAPIRPVYFDLLFQRSRFRGAGIAQLPFHRLRYGKGAGKRFASRC